MPAVSCWIFREYFQPRQARKKCSLDVMVKLYNSNRSIGCFGVSINSTLFLAHDTVLT